jgi:hypothetical protein
LSKEHLPQVLALMLLLPHLYHPLILLQLLVQPKDEWSVDEELQN